MKIPVVFGFVAIAVFFIVSPVSAEEQSFDPNGVWYVVAQDAQSKLNLHCWDVLISTSDSELKGNATSQYTDGSGERHVVSMRFRDTDITAGDIVTITIRRSNGRVFGPQVTFFLTMINDHTIRLFNTQNSKKYHFTSVYLSRSPLQEPKFYQTYGVTAIDNSCIPMPTK